MTGGSVPYLLSLSYRHDSSSSAVSIYLVLSQKLCRFPDQHLIPLNQEPAIPPGTAGFQQDLWNNRRLHKISAKEMTLISTPSETNCSYFLITLSTPLK
jgi:hypothetical protein